MALSAIILSLAVHSTPVPEKFPVYVGSQEPNTAAMQAVGGLATTEVTRIELERCVLILHPKDKTMEALRLRIKTWNELETGLDKDNSIDLGKLSEDSAQMIVRSMSSIGIQGLTRKGRVFLGVGLMLNHGADFSQSISIPADIDPLPDPTLSRGGKPPEEKEGPLISGKFFASRFYEYGSQPILAKDRRKAVAEAIEEYESMIDALRAASLEGMTALSRKLCDQAGLGDLLDKCGKDLHLGMLTGKKRERILGFLMTNRRNFGLGEESDVERMFSKAGSFRLQPVLDFMVSTPKGGAMLGLPFTPPGSKGT